MSFTTQLNLVYKLECISGVEQGNIGQNLVIAEALGQFDWGKCLLIDFPLNFLNANNHLDTLSFFDSLAHSQQIALIDDSTFAHLLVRLITDAVSCSPR